VCVCLYVFWIGKRKARRVARRAIIRVKVMFVE